MATSSKQLVHAHTGLPYVTEFTACLLFYVKQVYLYLKSLECLTGHACTVIQSLLLRYKPACCSVCGRLLFVYWLCKFRVNSHCVCYISHAHPHTPDLHTLTHIHIYTCLSSCARTCTSHTHPFTITLLSPYITPSHPHTHLHTVS